MDILIYLIELIQNRKDIGLNGLGTLYKKKSPGRYDAETHLFLPPSYVLAFTSEVKEDQNLALFISKKRNISVESSNYFISEYVENIRRELDVNGQFIFENLGKLSFIDGELQFTPVKDVNFGFDFYGLPPVNSAANETHHQTLTENIEIENRAEEENPGDEHLIEPTTELTANQEKQSADNEPAAIENEHDSWSFDELPETPAVVELKQESKVEEPLEALINEPILNQVATDEEVYEEINEVTIPPVQNTNKEIEAEEIELDFSKNWDFDEPTTHLQEKTSELVSPYEEEAAEELDETDKGMPSYLKVLLGALVLLIIVAILYFINPNLFSSFTKNDINPDQKIAVPLAEQENLKSQADSLAKADEIVKNAQGLGLEVEPARDTLKAKVTTKTLSGITYEVISVAFETQKEADKYIEVMKTRGIVAKPVPSMPGKRIKISVATFNNLDSASKQLPDLKKTLKNPDLYIFTNKPKEK